MPRMEAFVTLQVAAAPRRSETLGLFWDQIDRYGRQAKMPTSKIGRPRKLALRTEAVVLLKQLPRTSDLVFDILLRTLLEVWRRICKAAGIEDLRIHDLRHEGIRCAAESGLFPTILDLQAFSGHRDLRSLSRYTHMCTTALAIRADQAEAVRLEKMEHNGRLRLKQSALSNLGGAADTVRVSPSVLDAPPADEAALPSNVVVFRAFRSASQS
ncbi:site-specific integrase [Variovorax sp. 22077]|uniref:site-specific integrase n=1 Tax=Variovorax sp. 22077 TaxID=3453867 RepID=UPI003F827DA7